MPVFIAHRIQAMKKCRKLKKYIYIYTYCKLNNTILRKYISTHTYYLLIKISAKIPGAFQEMRLM